MLVTYCLRNGTNPACVPIEQCRISLLGQALKCVTTTLRKEQLGARQRHALDKDISQSPQKACQGKQCRPGKWRPADLALRLQPLPPLLVHTFIVYLNLLVASTHFLLSFRPLTVQSHPVTPPPPSDGADVGHVKLGQGPFGLHMSLLAHTNSTLPPAP